MNETKRIEMLNIYCDQRLKNAIGMVISTMVTNTCLILADKVSETVSLVIFGIGGAASMTTLWLMSTLIFKLNKFKFLHPNEWSANKGTQPKKAQCVAIQKEDGSITYDVNPTEVDWHQNAENPISRFVCMTKISFD